MQGESAGFAGRRSGGIEALARRSAEARRLGEQAGAAVSLSRFAGLHAAWGAPDDRAWERAHDFYLARFDEFSDIQEQRPRRWSNWNDGGARHAEPRDQARPDDQRHGGRRLDLHARTGATELSSAGIEVVLAALGGAADRQQQIAEAARDPGSVLLGSDFKLEWMEDPWAMWKSRGAGCCDLERRVQSRRRPSEFVRPWRACLARPVVLTAHSCVLSWWQAVRGRATRRRRGTDIGRWWRDRFESADLVTAPSDAMAAALARELRLAADVTCRVIPNGRDTDAISARGEGAVYILPRAGSGTKRRIVAAVAQCCGRSPGLSMWRANAGPRNGIRGSC